jgi:hypothetical protein
MPRSGPRTFTTIAVAWFVVSFGALLMLDLLERYYPWSPPMELIADVLVYVIAITGTPAIWILSWSGLFGTDSLWQMSFRYFPEPTIAWWVVMVAVPYALSALLWGAVLTGVIEIVRRRR